MRRAVVCGAGGFIGGHLVEYLKSKGYWVMGIDIKEPEYRKIRVDKFVIVDLRTLPENYFEKMQIDEIYQLASDMGGMGFIHTHALDCLTNNVTINMKVLAAAAKAQIPRYFYSSSVCIYPDMKVGDKPLCEEDAYPAKPDNEYGWEKLYSERLALQYAKDTPMQVRIARFQNCFGEFGTYDGGREKAPAAMCRKIASVNGGDTIEVWGDGTAVRNYIYVKDLVRAVYILMQSNMDKPVNIGTEEYITVNELIEQVCRISGKRVKKKYVDGAVGVQSRNFTHHRMHSLGWSPEYTIKQGLIPTYDWIEKQVINQKGILDNPGFKNGQSRHIKV